MTRWYEQLSNDNEYWAENAKLDFAVSLERLMQKAGISKSELARKIKSSPAYITQILRGDSNLTIDSMVKLSRATGGNLHITISPQATSAEWGKLIEANHLWTESGEHAEAWIQRAQHSMSKRNGDIEIQA